MTAPAEAKEQVEANLKCLEQELVQHMRASQMLDDRKFDQLSCAEAIAAAGGRSSYTVFDLGDGVTLKAWTEYSNPTVIPASVCDRHGKVLHEYKPVELPLKEITALAP